MKIVAFGASNSKHSINKKLATYTSSLFSQASSEILDLNDYEMPIFSVDREQQSGYPQEAHNFLKKIGGADLVIISLAEHNGSYTAAFKNIFDWSSRINGKVFQDKPVLLMSTSPGSRGGKSVIETAIIRFPFHGANIVGTFSLAEFGKNYTDEQGITDSDMKNSLLGIINQIESSLS